MEMNAMKEKVMKLIFGLAACISILSVALICGFLLLKGGPAIAKIGLPDFLLGKTWRPANGLYGILPMILGSLWITGCSILLGVPLALFTSVFLVYFCPKKWIPVFRQSIQLMAGIPSIIYGFFGLVVLVPLIRNIFGLQTGNIILTAAVLLAIMILPTVISVAETAIRGVPQAYYEGALALGATHTRSVFSIVLPAAKSGIFAGIALGIGRAVGETMAVIMVAGNQARIPTGVTKGARTMTANIVLEMGYAADLHREALIAVGIILFVFILLINLAIAKLNRGKRRGK